MNARADTHRRRLISVDDYHRMGDVGIFAPGERVELIEGEIIEMAPIGNPHQSIVDRITELLVSTFRGQAIVRTQGSIRLSDFSEPEPDIALLAFRDDYYRSRAATTADVLLVIEVADTSLRYDRQVKAPFYARHGIAEFWLIDVQAGAVTVYQKASGGEFHVVQQLAALSGLRIAALPDAAMDLSFVADSGGGPEV